MDAPKLPLDGLEMPAHIAPALLSDDDEVLDAQAVLAKAIVLGAAPVSNDFVRASVFLRMYLGPQGAELADLCLSYKARQAPGFVRHLREAIKAFSALDLVRPFTIAGGAGGK